jgi:hypothetical protein
VTSTNVVQLPDYAFLAADSTFKLTYSAIKIVFDAERIQSCFTMTEDHVPSSKFQVPSNEQPGALAPCEAGAA